MKKLAIIFIYFCGFFAGAQNDPAAQMYGEILSATDSLRKLDIYSKLSDHYYDHNQFERALHFSNKGLALASELKDTTFIIQFNLGQVYIYDKLGARSHKLDASFKGIKYSEGKKDLRTMIEFYRELGEDHWHAGDNHKSIEYYTKALKLATELKDTTRIAGIYNNLGLTCRSLKDYDAASGYYFKSIEIGQARSDHRILEKTFNNIGYLRFTKGDYLDAIEYYKLGLKSAEILKDEFQIGLIVGNIGQTYLFLNKMKEAEANMRRSLEIAVNIGDLEGEIENYKNLVDLFEKKGDHKAALEMHKKYLAVILKYETENKEKDIKREEAKREFESEIAFIQEQQGLKDALARSEKDRSRHIIMSIAIGFFIVLVLLVIIFNRFKVSQAQRVVIENQKKLVDEKQKEILDSIHYAKRIQATLLAHVDFVNQNLPNNFIYFQPKDIVSGDFYWATKHNDLFYLAVCDSTGHGVPGAFMSLLNIGFLSEAINEKNILEPAAIFDHARRRLISGISKEGQKDGFDGILICIDKKAGKIQYAGANNAPVLVKNSTAIELAFDKMPVGVGEKLAPFTQNELEITTGDTLYLFTDGYADQFGGPKGKKFKHSELITLIASSSHLSLAEQKIKLENTFLEWKGVLEQVDDVCIIGIRL